MKCKDTNTAHHNIVILTMTGPAAYGGIQRTSMAIMSILVAAFSLSLIPLATCFSFIPNVSHVSTHRVSSTRMCPSFSTVELSMSSTTTTIYTPPNLSNKIALVTGASRGIGKGIALELGASGCTVYVSGRSSRATGGPTTERDLGSDNTDCTIERTAEEIDALPGNGKGIPIQCDVECDEQIAAMFDTIRSEQGGQLDVVVASAFKTPPMLNGASFRDDFWKQGAAMWDACNNVGLRATYLTCCAASPLMIDTAKSKTNSGGCRPLMVIVSSFGGKSYTFNVAYGVGKAGCDRLASDMGVQLAKHNVDTVSIYPGVVRTEGNLEMDRQGDWDAASGGLDLSLGETPRFSGRAVAKLLADPERMKERSGDVVVVAELAKELGFTDIDGLTPPSIRSMKFILPNFVFPQIEKESGTKLPSWVTDNVPDYLLPWSVFTRGPPPSAD